MSCSDIVNRPMAEGLQRSHKKARSVFVSAYFASDCAKEAMPLST